MLQGFISQSRFLRQIVFHCSRHFACLFQWGAEDLWYTINQISPRSPSLPLSLCFSANPPIFSHPCRPEEGVFYGKPGPPGFDRGSKLIAGLVELSQHTEQRGRERFLFRGGGRFGGTCAAAPLLLGSGEEILAAVVFTGRCRYDLFLVRQREAAFCAPHFHMNVKLPLAVAEGRAWPHGE